MKTYPTLEAARAAAQLDKSCLTIAEIDHATDGRCYIGAKCGYIVLKRALESKPMPEIKCLIAEHPVQDPAEAEAAKAAFRTLVPGLDELRAARADESRYHERFERMMEDEGNDGARSPKPVKVSADALKVQYPAAWSYIVADGWAGASHHAKAAAGRKAVERIKAGDDHAAVIADMEAEWTKHCQEHIWD